MRVLSVFGTRPEAIKMAPVVKAIESDHDLQSIVCTTGQHRQMLDPVLDFFGIAPDVDLGVMSEGQSLASLTALMLKGLDNVLTRHAPDLVLVHGDTATTLAASLAAFYHRIPIGHVEAGLRSGDRLQPWPEEVNRRLADVMATYYFAPTQSAKSNLLAERTDPRAIHITGNTGIDALKFVLERLHASSSLRHEVEAKLSFLHTDLPILLVTGHRRENFGAPFRELCQAIADLASSGHMQVVYPVHLNPQVQKPVREILGDVRNVHLIPPLDYVPFVALMQRSHAILTDSGGIQEEAPTLGKPVFVMRNVTERPEAVEAGVVRLVGTDRSRIVADVEAAFTDSAFYGSMSHALNPYGDGFAAKRIAAIAAGRHVLPWSGHSTRDAVTSRFAAGTVVNA